MAGLYPSSSVPYWKSLRVLRSILAVARIALFWPEILDVTPGICWSPSLRRLPQEPVLSSPFTSSLAPLSALSISWASLIPPDVAVIWYSYTYHYSFLLLLFQHQYVQLVSHQKVVHLYLEVQHDQSFLTTLRWKKWRPFKEICAFDLRLHKGIHYPVCEASTGTSTFWVQSMMQ